MAFLNIGDITLNKEADEEGDKRYSLKLNPKVKILIDGHEVAPATDKDGKVRLDKDGNPERYIMVRSPKQNLRSLRDREKISPEDYDREVADFEPGGSRAFVKLKLSAVTKDK